MRCLSVWRQEERQTPLLPATDGSATSHIDRGLRTAHSGDQFNAWVLRTLTAGREAAEREGLPGPED
jgi:hypothetical protein